MHIHGKICPGGKWLIELMKFWLLLLKYGYRISIAYGLDMFFYHEWGYGISSLVAL